MGSPAVESVTEPKKRRLPFKRTVTHRDPGDDAAEEAQKEDDIEFFRRTNDVLPLALKELRRSQTPEEKSSPEQKGSFHPSPDKPDRKRAKITLKSDDSERDGSPQASPTTAGRQHAVLSHDSSDSDLIMDVKGKGKEIVRSVKTPVRRKIPNTGASNASALVLDSDNDVHQVSRKSRSLQTPTPGKDQSPSRAFVPGGSTSPVTMDNDDEEQDAKTRDVEDCSDSDVLEIIEPEKSDELDYWIQRAKQLETGTQNVVVEILVSSRVAHTVPLGIKRRLNQVIRPILDTWIAKQRSQGIDLPDEVAARMFLTWKGNKVYNNSAVASLGIQVDASGNIKTTGEGFRGGKLNIEVWTDEAYADFLAEVEWERRMQLGIYDDEEASAPGDDNAEVIATIEPEKKRYKVRLKTKDREPIPCRISDDYTVQDIINHFRRVTGIDESHDISIWFDGEQLDKASLAADADLDPDEINQLEVHVK